MGPAGIFSRRGAGGHGVGHGSSRASGCRTERPCGTGVQGLIQWERIIGWDCVLIGTLTSFCWLAWWSRSSPETGWSQNCRSIPGRRHGDLLGLTLQDRIVTGGSQWHHLQEARGFSLRHTTLTLVRASGDGLLLGSRVYFPFLRQAEWPFQILLQALNAVRFWCFLCRICNKRHELLVKVVTRADEQ